MHSQKMPLNQLSHLFRRELLEYNERSKHKSKDKSDFRVHVFKRGRTHTEKCIGKKMKAKEKSTCKWFCKVEFSI